MRGRLLLALLALFCLAAGPPSAARRHRRASERAIIDEYVALLSIPNVASDLGDMRRNAAHIEKMFARRGVVTRRLEVPGAPPAIYGELRVPGARQTLLFYAHYDGQPVEPEAWVGRAPFRPILRDGSLESGGKPIRLPAPGRPFDPEWRLYARSAGDDKAPILAWMVALDALRGAGIPLRSNILFFLDGEEEAGSPHLSEILRRHRDLLRADVWIFCDGPVHQNRSQQIAFGARGQTGLQLTVYGARRELHSGHYGNWAPNPADMLARLVSSMRDADGRVLVRGFYDDVAPLSPRERRALAEAPRHDAALRQELWLARTEGRGKRLDELINLPALNVRGLASAGVGERSRNVIPGSATASLELRLVKGMDHRRAVDGVIRHIQAQGYHVVESEPDAATRRRHPRVARVERESGYNAVRARMDLPIAQKIVRAVESARGDVILMPTLGGSLPLAPIDAILRAPVIIVPIANHDNNQHAHNENIRIQNLWDGIETMAALLAMD
ncbi:MAG TPA: M20/M25/M40 family metallo-hydrolase [Kofleriaceae bacterium]|nr:M20/M25/M40 family metallo-hydrolase [Kofleriaceae bacterium]